MTKQKTNKKQQKTITKTTQGDETAIELDSSGTTTVICDFNDQATWTFKKVLKKTDK